MSNSKKNIVHLTFDMRIGGAEKVIACLAENTDRSKYRVSILCLEAEIGPFGKNLSHETLSVKAFGRKPGFDVKLVVQLNNYIRKHDVSIVHSHQYTPYIYGLLAARGTGAKVIFTEHGRFYPDKRRLKRIILNPLFNKFTDAVTAISCATRDALVQYENFPVQAIKVIYNGIMDPRLIAPQTKVCRDQLDIADKAFVLGAVSRLDPIKNHRLMLHGLKEIKKNDPNTILLIVGDGPERENLKSYAAELGVSDHVIFTGFRQDVGNLYPLMDVFLLPSFSEGTAMTLLEAMAAGIPSIVTDVGGNPEIIHNGKTGFVIASDNLNEFVQCVSALHEKRELRKEIGDAARKEFEKRFTIDKMVGEYQLLYEKICE